MEFTDDELWIVREAVSRYRDELAAVGFAGEHPEPMFLDAESAAEKLGMQPYYDKWKKREEE